MPSFTLCGGFILNVQEPIFEMGRNPRRCGRAPPILSTGLAVLAAAQALAHVDVARLHQSRVVHDAVHDRLGRDSRQRRALSEISAVRDPRRAEAGLLQHARARREAGAAGPARAEGRPGHFVPPFSGASRTSRNCPG